MWLNAQEIEDIEVATRLRKEACEENMGDPQEAKMAKRWEKLNKKFK